MIVQWYMSYHVVLVHRAGGVYILDRGLLMADVTRTVMQKWCVGQV